MRSNNPKLPSIRSRRKRVCTHPELMLSLCEWQEGSVSLTLHTEELSLLEGVISFGTHIEHSHLRHHDIPTMWLHHVWLPWSGGSLHGSLVEGNQTYDILMMWLHIWLPWSGGSLNGSLVEGFYGYWIGLECPNGYHNTLKLEAFTLLITVRHYEWDYSLFVNYRSNFRSDVHTPLCKHESNVLSIFPSSQKRRETAFAL